MRRERRRLDAREQLRTGHDMLTAMGTEAFAARAARELRASAETVRRRKLETDGELARREAQIAQLARHGLSNADVAARLFVSPRTAEYHLSRIFARLDISSRRELPAVLSIDPDMSLPA